MGTGCSTKYPSDVAEILNHELYDLKKSINFKILMFLKISITLYRVLLHKEIYIAKIWPLLSSYIDEYPNTS